MKPLVIVPGNQPLSLQDAKDHMGLNDLSSDARIDSCISQAKEYAEWYLSRTLMPTTLEIRLDAFPAEIELPRPPVASVVSIKYIDPAGDLQTLSPAAYVLDNFPLVPYIRPVFGGAWPATRAERNAVRVQYVAGYADAASIPESIRAALFLLVGHWVNQQSRIEAGDFITRVPKAAEQQLDIERNLLG